MTSIQRLYNNLDSDEVLDVSGINLATGQGAVIVKKDAAIYRYEERQPIPGMPVFPRIRMPDVIPGPYNDYYKPDDWNPPIISNRLPQFIMAIHHIFGPRGISMYENDITLAARQLNADVQRTEGPRVTLPPRSPPRATLQHGAAGTTLVPPVQQRTTTLPVIAQIRPPTVPRPTITPVVPPTVQRPRLPQFSPPRPTFQPTTNRYPRIYDQ